MAAPTGPGRGPLAALLHEYRPSVVTGGASALPLLVLAAINMADEFDRVAFGLLLPEIQDWFGVSLTTILTVSAIAGVLPILLAAPIGYLADRRRRTTMVAAGTGLWGTFSILTAFAPSMALLGAARLGSGLGKTLDPVHASLLSDHYPPDRRAGVFALHRFGNELGQMVAPVVAGLLASIFFWQLPFLVFGVPAFVLGAYVLVALREPVRGAPEQAVAGADLASDAGAAGAAGPADDGGPPEPPPGWSESWRTAKGVRTLRRIWMALPFLVGSFLGVAALMSAYYSEEFGLGSAGRGFVFALVQACNVVGLLVGGSVGNRLMARRPSRVVSLAGVVALVPAACFALIAVSPWLPLSIALQCIGGLALPFFSPATSALISLVVPARVRGFAFAVGAVFVAPGIFVAPLAGALGDAYGVRTGVLVLAPVFALGAFIIASAGQSVDADMRAATAAAAALRASRRTSPDGPSALLVCRDVDVSYGPVQVLFGVDLEVAEGEVVALLGTNGAGKSTLLRAIGGDTPAANGAIVFDGEDITHLPPREHVRRSIVQVPGGKAIFPGLTVAQNLELARWGAASPEPTADAIERVLAFFPVLKERLEEPAGNLSGGQQQMVALGQALLTTPRLLIIDELSLGLAPAVVEQLLGLVRELNGRGTTVLLVEQSVNVALTVAQRAVFMEKGEVRFSGPTAELLRRPDILRSVFLAGAGAARRKEPVDAEAPVVLRASGLSKSFGGVAAVDGVDLEVREHEVVGLIGPNGAGKTTVFDLLSGHTAPDGGAVELFAEDVTGLGPHERAALGLHRSFQEARLFPALTVEENLLVALDRHLSSRSSVAAALRLPTIGRAEDRLRKRAERLLLLLGLGVFRDRFVRELSTGTRRIVDLACVLASEPAVLLLDEPSSGLAQRETEELGPLIQRIKFEAACSVVIIEHDMALVSGISDRLVAFETGRTIATGTPDEVLADPRVIQSYLGTDQHAIARSGARSHN